MEDNAIRAVFIGVSIMVTMLTLSLVMMYYNTAKNLGDIVNQRKDIANTFDLIVNDSETFEDKLSGTEVRSLIRKYAGDSRVRINIVSIKDISTSSYQNVNNAWLYKINKTNQETEIIDETKLSIINPAWQSKVTKVESGGTIVLNVHLDNYFEVE